MFRLQRYTFSMIKLSNYYTFSMIKMGEFHTFSRIRVTTEQKKS